MATENKGSLIMESLLVMLTLAEGALLDLRRKWSPTANDSQTENDPQIGPQMIPNLKWTANDPAVKRRMAWSLVSRLFFNFYIYLFIFIN